MKALLRFVRDEQGGSMVEFAIVFTFMFLPLMFGAVEFGRGLWVKSTVTAAAREGVRWAIVHGSDTLAASDTAAISAKIIARTKLTPLAIKTTFTPAGQNTPGSYVKIEVAYAYTPIVGNFAASLGGRAVSIPFLSSRTIKSTSQQVIAY
jgi:Flp pilus assembly protein TadG